MSSKPVTMQSDLLSNDSQLYRKTMGIICILVSFSTMLYFPLVELLSIISIRVPSIAYIIYNYSVFGLALLSTCVTLCVKGTKIKNEIKGIILELFVLCLYFVYGFFVEQNTTYFFYHLLWAVPALLVGLFVSQIDKGEIQKFLEPIALIMGITAFLSARRYISAGVSHLNTLTFGGTNYQGLSYTAAFCVGLELYYVFLSGEDRFLLFRSKIGKIAEFIVGGLSAFAVVVSGGRGGLILLLLNVLIFVLLIRKRNVNNRKTRRILFFFICILIGCLVFSAIKSYGNNSLITDSLTRLTSVITTSDQNASYVKGRNEIYSLSFSLILNNPMWGYGIFNTEGTGLAYPHNILLETCIQAGFFYMFIWICIFIYLWKVMIKRMKSNPYYYIFTLFLTYSTVFLNVSGTYLWCSELWFLIGFICSDTKVYRINCIDEEQTNSIYHKEWKYIKSNQ